MSEPWNQTSDPYEWNKQPTHWPDKQNLSDLSSVWPVGLTHRSPDHIVSVSFYWTPTHTDVRLECAEEDSVRGSDRLLRLRTALEVASTIVLFTSSVPSIINMCIIKELYIKELFSPVASSYLAQKSRIFRFQILVDSIAQEPSGQSYWAQRLKLLLSFEGLALWPQWIWLNFRRGIGSYLGSFSNAQGGQNVNVSLVFWDCTIVTVTGMMTVLFVMQQKDQEQRTPYMMEQLTLHNLRCFLSLNAIIFIQEKGGKERWNLS